MSGESILELHETNATDESINPMNTMNIIRLLVRNLIVLGRLQ